MNGCDTRDAAAQRTPGETMNAQAQKEGKKARRAAFHPLRLSSVSMSKMAVLNSHHLPPLPRTMLLTYRQFSSAVWGALPVITEGAKPYIHLSDPLDYATRCALRGDLPPV